MPTPRLMVVFTLATAGVVLIIAALAFEEWWLLPIALLAHATGAAITVASTRRAIEQGGKPDPVTEARVEEEAKASDDEDEPQAAADPGKGEEPPTRRGDGDEPRMAI